MMIVNVSPRANVVVPTQVARQLIEDTMALLTSLNESSENWPITDTTIVDALVDLRTAYTDALGMED